MLKGQDILVALLLASDHTKVWTQAEIARGLGLSLGEVNNALRRGAASGILRKTGSKRLVLRLNQNNLDESMRHYVDKNSSSKRSIVSGFTVVTSALEELLVHGLKYFIPPVWGEVVRGIPTAYAAPIMTEIIVSNDHQSIVWEHPKGSIRGVSLEPIHENAPTAALRFPDLYDLLALTDVLRTGRSREIAAARELLGERLRGKHDK